MLSSYNKIYIQNDKVPMGSLLRPILANIFTVEQENIFVYRLHEHVKKRRCYPGDTFVYVKNESIDYILTTLYLFHSNISFTNEIVNNSQLTFLDLLSMRNGGHLDTTVYRKYTHNDQYLHWSTIAPASRKRKKVNTS